MRLSKERYDDIDREVYQLIMDFNPDRFPFGVVSIAEWMEYKLCPYSSLSSRKRDALLNDERTSSGFHICDLSGPYPEFRIFFNDDGEMGRWLFTIGHEIGHIVLKHGSKPDKFQEAEADYFAKQLMLPRCLAVALCLVSPKEIHDNYRLSWEAAEYLAESVERTLVNKGQDPYKNDVDFIAWSTEKGWI